jgi:hypothetical protein
LIANHGLSENTHKLSEIPADTPDSVMGILLLLTNSNRTGYRWQEIEPKPSIQPQTFNRLIRILWNDNLEQEYDLDPHWRIQVQAFDG